MCVCHVLLGFEFFVWGIEGKGPGWERLLERGKDKGVYFFGWMGGLGMGMAIDNWQLVVGRWD